jgi:hypothetical protein
MAGFSRTAADFFPRIASGVGSKKTHKSSGEGAGVGGGGGGGEERRRRRRKD